MRRQGRRRQRAVATEATHARPGPAGVEGVHHDLLGALDLGAAERTALTLRVLQHDTNRSPGADGRRRQDQHEWKLSE